MTSIQQRVMQQSVLAGIDEPFPGAAPARPLEDLRRLPDENIKALDDVGFFKLIQPEQWGGLQCDPTVFYEAVRRLASACGSTGRVARHLGYPQLAPGAVRPNAQDGVWGRGPQRAHLVVHYAPMGAGVVTEAGDGSHRQRCLELVLRM